MTCTEVPAAANQEQNHATHPLPAQARQAMSAYLVNAPEPDTWPGSLARVFLAGTIEQGTAAHWQARAIERLDQMEREIVILNPRRPDWDASWRGHPDDEPFRTQVEWELDHLARANLVLIHLEEGSRSPVSLLELGWLAAARPGNTMVSCNSGFWRWGNVAMVAERFGLRLFPCLDTMLEEACTCLHGPRKGATVVSRGGP